MRRRRTFWAGEKGRLNNLTLPDCKETESHEEIVTLLWLGSIRKTNQEECKSFKSVKHDNYTECIRWAVNGFGGFKRPGPDESSSGNLSSIFRSCLTLIYAHKPCREVKEIFILKSARSFYVQAKYLRPIGFASFLFETLERMIVRYVQQYHFTKTDSQVISWIPGR